MTNASDILKQKEFQDRREFRKQNSIIRTGEQ